MLRFALSAFALALLAQVAVAEEAKRVSTKPTRPAPVAKASFGPNGTHWPSLIPTPSMYDATVPNIVHVECTWEAIAAALKAVTPEQANAGVLIKISPGNLEGKGTSTPMLKDLGSAEWKKRVTVCPRDGYGTVTFSGSINFTAVDGVCFAGFSGDNWKLQGCNRSAIAWSKVARWFAGYGLTGRMTEKVEICELVQPVQTMRDGDTADIYSSEKGPVDGWLFAGCYAAPSYRPANSKAHEDTLQFAGKSPYNNMSFVDCAYFASNNCAIQTGGIEGLHFEHCWIAAGEISRKRFPWPEGADNGPRQAEHSFNGGGSNMTAKDTVFIGGLSMSIGKGKNPQPWAKVENAVTNHEYTGSAKPREGNWIVMTDEEILAKFPLPTDPTDEYLNSIWK